MIRSEHPPSAVGQSHVSGVNNIIVVKNVFYVILPMPDNSVCFVFFKYFFVYGYFDALLAFNIRRFKCGEMF